MPIHDFHKQNNSFHRNSIRIRWKHRHRFYNYRCGNRSFRLLKKGYRMVPSSLKVLAKFGFCSNCSQKLDECMLACSCSQNFFKCSHARIRVSFKFLLRVAYAGIICILETKTDTGKNISRMGNWETCARDECF